MNIIDPTGMFGDLGSMMGTVALISAVAVIATGLYMLIKSVSLKLAVAEAGNMVNSAVLQLQSWGTKDKLRYKTWFGKYTVIRKTSVEDVYLKIAVALSQNIKFHQTNGNYYAYTYPGGPLEIWLGKDYYSAPLVGANSKAGTIIHELSHEVSNTSDTVYGIVGAKSLAVTAPNNAINNADNYEFFAEGVQ